MRTRSLILWLFFFLFALVLVGCETPIEPPPAPDSTPTVVNDVLIFEVQANENQFIPSEFVVAVNQPVLFRMTSIDDFHTFTVKRDEADTEDLFSLQVLAGFTDEITWTFEETGDYYLYCVNHEQDGMVGTIRVTDQ
jgi:plastocyanin